MELNKIYNEDCLEGMKRIPDGSVDIVVTSPPYNIGKTYGVYDDNKDFGEYTEWCRLWMNELKRVVKNNGSIWINSGYVKTGRNQTMPLSYEYYKLMDLPMVQEVVWHYEGGMSYKKRFTHRTERWQWFSKRPSEVLFNLDDVRDLSLNRTNDKRNHPLGKNPTDYWYFDRVVGGTGKTKEKTKHPAQFPAKMIERVLKACSEKGQLVLDPFMGSGTTAIAAINTNRNYIGFELDEEYCNMAKNRVKKHTRQLALV